jgi:hypothetical protein
VHTNAKYYAEKVEASPGQVETFA